MESVIAIFDVKGDTDRLLPAYDRAMPMLKSAAGEIGAPSVHICAAAPEGVRIVDVWDSAEALRRFSESPRFREILAASGMPAPTAVTVSPVHALGWPAGGGT